MNHYCLQFTLLAQPAITFVSAIIMAFPNASAQWGTAVSSLNVLHLASQFAENHRDDIKNFVSTSADRDGHRRYLQSLMINIQQILGSIEKVTMFANGYQDKPLLIA